MLNRLSFDSRTKMGHFRPKISLFEINFLSKIKFSQKLKLTGPLATTPVILNGEIFDCISIYTVRLTRRLLPALAGSCWWVIAAPETVVISHEASGRAAVSTSRAAHGRQSDWRPPRHDLRPARQADATHRSPSKPA